MTAIRANPAFYPRPAAPDRHCAPARDASDFSAIDTPGVNLVLWHRQLPYGCAVISRRLIREKLRLKADLQLADVERYLLRMLSLQGECGHGGIAFIHDIVMLAHIFGRVAGSHQLQLQLETVDADACRLFHVDRVRLRLVTSYAGAGLQWLRDEQVRRSALGRGSNRGIIRHGEPETLNAGDVALFKGACYPGSGSQALVHRSPPPAQPRLRLKLDISNQGKPLFE